jgi:hypothetical protein
MQVLLDYVRGGDDNPPQEYVYVMCYEEKKQKRESLPEAGSKQILLA